MNKCKFLIFLIGILNSLFHGRRLVGIDSIMSALGWQQYVTVLDMRISYPDFPVKKVGGQFIAYKNELRRWQKNHPEAVERKRPPFEIIQHRTIALRWGLKKTEWRRIVI